MIIERRHHSDVALRTALLRRGTADQLLRCTDVNPYDTEVLERAVNVAGSYTPLQPGAMARLSVATTTAPLVIAAPPERDNEHPDRDADGADLAITWRHCAAVARLAPNASHVRFLGGLVPGRGL